MRIWVLVFVDFLPYLRRGRMIRTQQGTIAPALTLPLIFRFAFALWFNLSIQFNTLQNLTYYLKSTTAGAFVPYWVRRNCPLREKYQPKQKKYQY
jgi:hypothetical protein